MQLSKLYMVLAAGVALVAIYFISTDWWHTGTVPVESWMGFSLSIIVIIVTVLYDSYVDSLRKKNTILSILAEYKSVGKIELFNEYCRRLKLRIHPAEKRQAALDQFEEALDDLKENKQITVGYGGHRYAISLDGAHQS